MGDRERMDKSDTRWCAGYPRGTVHPVTWGNVPANEYIPGVTEIAGHSTNASLPTVPKHEKKYKILVSLIKNI